MRRDLDLMREIMLDARASSHPLDVSTWTGEGRSRSLVGYNVKLLRDAGMVEADIHGADDDPYYFCQVGDLTWEGQDYLASIAPPSVWRETKRLLARRGGDAAWAEIKALAARAAESLGL